MTARPKSGTVNRSHKKRDLSDHITGKAELLEKDAVDSPVQDVKWDVQQAEVHSDIALEEDKGDGNAVVIRSFDFQANPEAFQKHQPTKQELFNAHYQQIEVFLLKDGLKVIPEVNPQVKLSKNKKFYRIVVGAQARKGWGVLEKPKTLSEIAHGK